MKLYLTVVNLVAIITVLAINFIILPKLTDILAESSQFEIGPIRKRIYNLTAGFLIFMFLFNFYFWKIDNNLKEEKKKIEAILEMNPGDPVAQEKLKQIENKRKRYIAIIEPIFMIILGATIGVIAYSLIQPFYILLREIK